MSVIESSGSTIVTGASGLLGANLVLQMRQYYKNLIAIYNQNKFSVSGVKSLQMDLTEKHTIIETIQQLKPQWIILCAALTNVDWCEEHPEDVYRVNVEMSRNLAISARRVKAGLVYISTDSVFDGEKGNYFEVDTPAPLNVYAESKLAGEIAIMDELDNNLIIRTNIYGWNMQEKQSLAEWILKQLELGYSVPGFYDVIFSPILVNDLCNIIIEMIKMNLNGLYHVAGSQNCSKYKFALQLADTFKLESRLIQPVSIVDSFLKAPRPRNTSLKTSKVSKALGRLMPSVKSGLNCFKMLRDSGFVTNLKSIKGG